MGSKGPGGGAGQGAGEVEVEGKGGGGGGKGSRERAGVGGEAHEDQGEEKRGSPGTGLCHVKLPLLTRVSCFFSLFLSSSHSLRRRHNSLSQGNRLRGGF